MTGKAPVKQETNGKRASSPRPETDAVEGAATSGCGGLLELRVHVAGTDRPPRPGDADEGNAHPALRRIGGARVNVSRRVTVVSLTAQGPDAGKLASDGWLLNMSRGGVRLILEDDIVVEHQQVSLHVEEDGNEPGFHRPARVVWVRREPDGVIAGLEFLDGAGGSLPPPP